MSRATEHRNAAIGGIGGDWNATYALSQLVEAQIQATLYLAEQQRIANLIAWTTGEGITPSPDVERKILEGLEIAPQGMPEEPSDIGRWVRLTTGTWRGFRAQVIGEESFGWVVNPHRTNEAVTVGPNEFDWIEEN